MSRPADPSETGHLPGPLPGKVLPVTSPGPHSGLIMEVPEAEPAVARHRERLDASAPLGVPAHITVLFPFMAPATIGPALRGPVRRRRPHRTIGHGHPLSDLHAAEKSVRPFLPINGHATTVTLMTQQSATGRWAKAPATFTLAR